MLSRGALGLASSRTRRGIALSWIVLFILSLLLQYATFALAPAALAVHDEGLFELDGDTIAQNASAPLGPAEDWDSHPGATGARSLFITDGLGAGDDIFTTGSSKDDLNTTGWKWKIGSVQDKDDIEHAFAVSYDKSGHTFVYFGLDRFSNNGDAFTGFWFFKNGIATTATGGFTPAHTVGDLLVQADFTNGGAASTINLYEWVGSGGDTNGTLNKLGTGQVCTGAPVSDKACANTNSGPIDPSWNFDDKGTAGTNNPIPAESFFEGGIDLDQLFGGHAPCFSSFLAETRSSQSVDSTLSDFSGGSFNTCVPPTIATSASDSLFNLGGSVTDTANFTGNDGKAAGGVKFFVCGPNASATACTSGGTQVGGTVAVDTSNSVGTATSASFKPDATGSYCFRAEYAPNADSQYLAGSHTNATTECFKVVQPKIAITKVATPAGPVNAGDTIGFDIKVTNAGDGTATGVSMTDKLPTGLTWTAGAPTGDTAGVDCSIASGTLTCTDASMAAGDSFSVHLSAKTDPTNCGTVGNTANVTTTNDGTDKASASVEVLCPDVKVVKDAPSPQIPAGQNLVFKITTSNIGTGLAKDVVLKDDLPAGFDWTVNNNTDCSIAAGVLTCNFGDLKAGGSITVTLTAPTSANAETGNIDCSEGGVTVDNTGSATSSNEGQDVLGNNSDSASVDVLCSALFILKSFTGNTGGTDPDLHVPAAKIGDTLHYTLEYAGAGLLENAFITDVLPRGLDYVDGTAAGDANFDFTSATFNSSTGRWTLRWDAPALSAELTGFVSGAVTYDAKVLAIAPDQAQPLVNTATIDSDQTTPDSDTAAVAVLAPPEALTPPPTDTFTPQTGTSNPGFALMLILLGVAAMTITIGFITPAPARATRRRNRRG